MAELSAMNKAKTQLSLATIIPKINNYLLYHEKLKIPKIYLLNVRRRRFFYQVPGAGGRRLPAGQPD
jgi:hypothetical protein